jgi:hypothetical protein
LPGEFYCKLFLRKSYILLKVEYNLSYINTSFVKFFVSFFVMLLYSNTSLWKLWRIMPDYRLTTKSGSGTVLRSVV